MSPGPPSHQELLNLQTTHQDEKDTVSVHFDWPSSSCDWHFPRHTCRLCACWSCFSPGFTYILGQFQFLEFHLWNCSDLPLFHVYVGKLLIKCSDLVFRPLDLVLVINLLSDSLLEPTRQIFTNFCVSGTETSLGRSWLANIGDRFYTILSNVL